MTKLEVKKFGDSLFLLNNTNRYVVNYEIKEKSDLVVAYRLLNSTNYDMVLSDADYTLNLMQGSTEIRIVNEELLKGIHSFKLIMGLEPVGYSVNELSERLQLLENKIEKYVLFIDGVDEATTLPPLTAGQFWVKTESGYSATSAPELIKLIEDKLEYFTIVVDGKIEEIEAIKRSIELLSGGIISVWDKIFGLLGTSFPNEGWIFNGSDGDNVENFIEGGVA